MAKILLPVLALVIPGLSLLAAGLPLLIPAPSAVRLAAAAFLSPVLFAATYTLTAGLLSRIWKAAIIRGKFPRDLSHPVYGPRRLYAFCWCSVFYFTPLYFVLMSFPRLKKVFFTLFGYQGEHSNTVAPDVWLRDLPLLSLGQGSYVANKATVGTNLCLMDNTTLVDAVRIGEKSMVGHMALLAPGVKVLEHVELGVHTAVGIRTRFDKGSKTGPCVSIHHGVQIGENVDIGACTYVGLRAKVEAGIRLPAGSNIPAGAEIRNQEEATKFYSSETALLSELRVNGLRAVTDPKGTGRENLQEVNARLDEAS